MELRDVDQARPGLCCECCGDRGRDGSYIRSWTGREREREDKHAWPTVRHQLRMRYEAAKPVASSGETVGLLQYYLSTAFRMICVFVLYVHSYPLRNLISIIFCSLSNNISNLTYIYCKI